MALCAEQQDTGGVVKAISIAAGLSNTEIAVNFASKSTLTSVRDTITLPSHSHNSSYLLSSREIGTSDAVLTLIKFNAPKSTALLTA